MKVAAVLTAWVVLGVAQAAVDPNLDIRCCDCDLTPFNTAPGSGPQVMPSPFKITLNRDFYKLNDKVIVEVSSSEGYAFRDMILVAWPTDNRPKIAVGTIKLLNQEYPQHNVICYTSNHKTHGITVKDDKPMTNLRFEWETTDYAGHLEFRATFIVSSDIYWVAEKSALLVDPRPEAPPLPQPENRIIDPISTDDCGISKGCYREPEGCWELNCEYIVTWQPQSDGIHFELGGLTDTSKNRFVAVALSQDTYMGDDIVFACAHSHHVNEESTHVYLSVNKGNRNIHIGQAGENGLFLKEPANPGLTDEMLSTVSYVKETGASYHNGRLRCRFTMDNDFSYSSTAYIEDIPVHLLMARGFASRGKLQRHGLGVNELPIASPMKVDLKEVNFNIADRARYPLVKAHGCLMILAWIFFASLGLIMTKYYKTMWPNKRMFDQRYWFVAHFNCMATVFLVTIIGIILIFIEADGWTEAPDLPQRAHPILGIIIFVCIIINPILALIRPAEDSKCRPVFNWFHWAFGTIANVLAIPQIFIGMDFGKANIPWWATWILVIWVIFHIVIELSLEIHQCCTYKKNKERRRKYEQQRRENPKLHIEEPEPAGRRFKRFMLFLHLTVTIIITLIMIIIVAVC